MTVAAPSRLHQFVTIVGDGGEDLALATIQPSATDGLLRLEHVVRGKGRLLEYYFVQGRRVIHIESSGVRLAGTISTRWASAERVWEIHLLHDAPDHGIHPPLRPVAAAS